MSVFAQNRSGPAPLDRSPCTTVKEHLHDSFRLGAPGSTMGKSHVAASGRAKPARPPEPVPGLSRLLRLLGVSAKKSASGRAPTPAREHGNLGQKVSKPTASAASLKVAVKRAARSGAPPPSTSSLGPTSPKPPAKSSSKSTSQISAHQAWTVHCGGCNKSNPAMQEWCDFCGKEISPWTDPRFQLAGTLRG